MRELELFAVSGKHRGVVTVTDAENRGAEYTSDRTGETLALTTF